MSQSVSRRGLIERRSGAHLPTSVSLAQTTFVKPLPDALLNLRIRKSEVWIAQNHALRWRIRQFVSCVIEHQEVGDPRVSIERGLNACPPLTRGRAADEPFAELRKHLPQFVGRMKDAPAGVHQHPYVRVPLQKIDEHWQPRKQRHALRSQYWLAACSAACGKAGDRMKDTVEIQKNHAHHRVPRDCRNGRQRKDGVAGDRRPLVHPLSRSTNRRDPVAWRGSDGGRFAAAMLARSVQEVNRSSQRRPGRRHAQQTVIWQPIGSAMPCGWLAASRGIPIGMHDENATARPACRETGPCARRSLPRGDVNSHPGIAQQRISSSPDDARSVIMLLGSNSRLSPHRDRGSRCIASLKQRSRTSATAPRWRLAFREIVRVVPGRGPSHLQTHC